MRSRMSGFLFGSRGGFLAQEREVLSIRCADPSEANFTDQIFAFLAPLEIGHLLMSFGGNLRRVKNCVLFLLEREVLRVVLDLVSEGKFPLHQSTELCEIQRSNREASETDPMSFKR